MRGVGCCHSPSYHFNAKFKLGKGFVGGQVIEDVGVDDAQVKKVEEYSLPPLVVPVSIPIVEDKLIGHVNPSHMFVVVLYHVRLLDGLYPTRHCPRPLNHAV